MDDDVTSLPPSLRAFLTAYPHPAFVLSASPLHEALVTRQSLGHHTSQDAGPSVALSNSFSSDPSTGSRSGFSSNDPSPSIPSPADLILSSAFVTHSTASSAAAHPSRSSLLEGGDQIPHHPSRTAEGAVAAMYEQRAAEEGRRDVVDRERAISRNEEKVEGGWGGGQLPGVGGREGMGKGLGELLKPVWGNPRWADLVKKRGGEDDAELGVLALVGRQDAQKLLALLVNVLEPLSRDGVGSSGEAGETTYTATVQLHFPVESTHHRSLASRRAAAPPSLSTPSSSSDSNAYTESPSTSRGEIREPQLDLVATLYPSSNHLILTTVVHDLFTAPPFPPSSPDPPLSRPPLVQRPSSASTTSSTSTIIAPTLSPALLSSTTEPQSTDRTPAPLPQYSGVPYGIPGAPSPTAEGFPQGFVVERKKRRRRFRREGQEGLEEIGERVSGGREATVEEDRTEGEAERERREGNEGSGEESGSASRSGSASERGGEGERGKGLDEVALDSKLERARRQSGNGLAPPLDDPNLIVPSPPSPSRNTSVVPSPRSLFPDSNDPFLKVLSTTPMGRLIRAYPWEKSPLGPILAWERELKVMVTYILASPFRDAIWYGDQNVLIYNDEYANVAGAKHPEILGKSGAEGWAEIWDTLGPLSARVMQGETVSHYDHHLPMLRNGFLEETYHVWAFIPFRGPNGKVLGYENPSFETTARVIAERRLGTIRDLVQITSLARTIKDYCQKTLHSISGNAYDLPFALLYTCELAPTLSKRGSESGARSHDATAKETSTTAAVKLTLEGTIGVPDGHPSAPNNLTISVELSNSQQTPSSHDSASSTTSATATSSTATGPAATTIWPFREALQKKKPVFIADLKGRAKGFASRGWPELPKNAVVIPIMFEGDTSAIPKAVLIVGLNPRRPWNEVFATFLHLLARQIATGLFSVSSTEHDARRAEELLALDRIKTSFFANVSHELRTPLTLILGPLDDVLNSKDTLQPHDRERLITVQRHANRLLNMVNTLLDFSRLEGGRFEVTYRPTLIAAVTTDLASLFRAAIERGKIEFVVDCEEDPSDGRPVYLAAELWEKIVFNLIGNSFKYTMEGRITIRVRFSSKEAVLQVIDTGCGIEEKELGHIFDRFHRVEGTSRTHEGTGIGLALTRELVKVLGGTLEVVSEVGKGSTFSVSLPRGSDHLPPAQVVTKVAESVRLPPRAQYNLSIIEEAASWRVESSQGKEIQPSSASSSASNHSSGGEDTFLVTADLLNLKSSTVLLADDNHDLRTYIAGTLSKAFTVVQVEDGQAALEYCLRKPPSLIVTDIMMPRLDGRGLLAALRANPSTALIPVIFLSAEAGPEARVDALLAGVDDFLVKPFQSRELLARVNVHLQLGKMRSELERRVEERTRALIESEMRYRGLADRYSTLSVLSPVGIFMTDAEGKMSYANPRWFEISGHPTNKPLAEWRDSVLPEDLPRAEETWASAIKTGDGGQHMAEFRWRQGNWAQFELRPFHESGSKRGFVGAITDITTMKRLEEAHLQTSEQRIADAEENRRQMELFIDMASHELRNPLSGVWQNADILSGSIERMLETLEEVQRDGVADSADALEDLRLELQENAEAVDSILLCANHQGRIADDILNVSKINMGLVSVTPVPFEVGAKMADVLRMFDIECQQKQISLTLAKGASLGDLQAEWIVADPSRCAQVLLNFLSNSVKYTSDSKLRTIVVHIEAFEVPPPMSVHAMRVANDSIAQTLPPGHVWVQVSVRDSGKGLSPDEMKLLFARFSQANPKSDQYGGSGLGLYVSKKLVELHKGYIEVESIRGEGSTFSFAIPAARAAPPPKGTPPLPIPSGPVLGMRSSKRPTSSSDARTPISEEPPSLATAAPLHVLVVEDNLINQKVMVRQLKLARFLVTVANNGQEALDILLSPKATTFGPTTIDIVLMDIEMPVMDGLTAIRELRKLEAEGVVPVHFGVIAVTGNARQGQIDACREAGFDDVAIKPYRMTELLAQIQLLTGRDPATGVPPPSN